MIDPKLFAQVPHKNRTAYLDLFGTLARYYRVLAQAAQTSSGKAIPIAPIDPSGRPEDLLQAVQRQHAAVALALGVAPPPDLHSYDLRQPADWASFTWTLSQDLNRLRQAAGLA